MKIFAKIQRYMHTRQWKKVRENALAADALSFPSIYLSFIDKGFTDKDLVDRKKPICTGFSDIGVIVQYLEGMAIDIESATISNRFTVPVKDTPTRVIRADTFLYNSNKGEYMKVSDLMKTLEWAYSLIRIVNEDKSHRHGYRVRSFTMPLIEELHEILSEILK